MGARGYNAGGFAYMETVTCPRCGARRKLGHEAIKQGRIACFSQDKCDERIKRGHLLHRIEPPPMTDVKLPEKFPAPSRCVPSEGPMFSFDALKAYATAAVMAEREKHMMEGGRAEYVLALLVAGGHVTQAKVDEARRIAFDTKPPAERSSNSLSREDGDVHEQD